MAETADPNGDASTGMKLRTRRSGALSDISNIISDAAKRVMNSGAKRKSMVICLYCICGSRLCKVPVRLANASNRSMFMFCAHATNENVCA
jgi:hypothetical protein